MRYTNFMTVFLSSLSVNGKFDHIEAEMSEVLSIVRTIQKSAFPQCQQAIYFQPAWKTVAKMVRASSSVPIILMDSNFTFGENTKVPLVKKPPGRKRDSFAKSEWCVGWMLFLDNLENLQIIIDMI